MSQCYVTVSTKNDLFDQQDPIWLPNTVSTTDETIRPREGSISLWVNIQKVGCELRTSLSCRMPIWKVTSRLATAFVCSCAFAFGYFLLLVVHVVKWAFEEGTACLEKRTLCFAYTGCWRFACVYYCCLLSGRSRTRKKAAMVGYNKLILRVHLAFNFWVALPSTVFSQAFL